MNYLKIPLYIFVLSLQMLFSFSANAQEQSLTLQEAISLALENNRSLKVSDLDVSRAQQQTRIAKSKALPSVNLTGQYAHYFDRPVFFGLGGTSTQEDDKLSYSRIGGEDQFTTAVSVVQPLYNPSVKPELKLVVMSATVDPGPFSHFLGDCPVVTSEGRSFPVEIRYRPKRPEQSWSEATAAAIRGSVS